MVIALTAAILTWFFTGEMIRSVTILVVFCPCALVLATPTAIMAAIGNATKHGFLVREGDALERLAGVSRVSFDKTGTLTYGTPEVVAVHSGDAAYSEAQLYAYTAGAELRSEHPLGKSVVRCYRNNLDMNKAIPQPTHFQMLPGRGVQAEVEGLQVLAGNQQMLDEQNIAVGSDVQEQIAAYRQKGCTIIFVAINQRFAGFIALADTLRSDAADVISQIKQTGVTPVLLTGDHANAANHIGNQLVIGEVHAECKPEDKLNWIASSQQLGQQVCMIGDGINDAPALKKAYVGIAMGGIGSDIAVDAADIVLVNDEIKELPHLLHLAKRMMSTIKLNLIFSMSLNFLAIALAITCILNPVVGALVHNAGSVLVIINSALLLNWKKQV